MIMLPIFITVSPLHAIITFEKWYGGKQDDFGYSVIQTTDGGYIVAGATESNVEKNIDVYIIKTDSLGFIIWEKSYGGPNDDFGYSVIQTTDGDYIIAGKTESYGAGNYDIYLLKLNINGDTVWTKVYGGPSLDGAKSVIEGFDSTYIIAGYSASFGSGNKDACLIKTDKNGNTLWTKTYEGSNANSVAQTFDGGYIIVGRYNEDFYLTKTDVNGDIVWTKTYGGNDYDKGHSVTQTSDGGYIIAGETSSFHINFSDIYIVKTDPNGNTLWTKTYGGNYYDSGYSVIETTDGNYIVAGWTTSYGLRSDGSDAWLIKMAPNGDSLWATRYGGTGFDICFSIAQTFDQGYVMAGYTSSYGADRSDVYLIKTDRLGNTVEIPEADTISLFPNPFVPSKGHNTVTFENLPNQGLIIVYTVSSKLIWETSFSNIGGSYYWDVKTNDGKSISSGIYLYLIKDISGKVLKIDKFAIIR